MKALVDIHSYVMRTVVAYLFKVNLIQVDIVVSTLILRFIVFLVVAYGTKFGF